MQNKPLVSVVSPCYNGAQYLAPYFESLLAQDYENFELIFINDGSFDETESVALAYGEKLKERGVVFRYVHQENAGQAAAINRGLQLFDGEYLIWMDSDDVMYPNHISEKVRFLEEHPECGFVLAEGESVCADAMDRPISQMKRVKPEGEDSLFEDLIFEKNVVFCPGTIMVRRTVLLNAIPTRQIFESREGQNWQLMLPIAYTSKCGYLEKVLFKYVVHGGSHSRMRRTYQQALSRVNGFQELLGETINRLSSMPNEEKLAWNKRIAIKTNRRRLDVAYRYMKFRDALQCRRELAQLGVQLGTKDSFVAFAARKIKARMVKAYKKLR